MPISTTLTHARDKHACTLFMILNQLVHAMTLKRGLYGEILRQCFPTRCTRGAMAPAETFTCATRFEHQCRCKLFHPTSRHSLQVKIIQSKTDLEEVTNENECFFYTPQVCSKLYEAVMLTLYIRLSIFKKGFSCFEKCSV